MTKALLMHVGQIAGQVVLGPRNRNSASSLQAVLVAAAHLRRRAQWCRSCCEETLQKAHSERCRLQTGRSVD